MKASHLLHIVLLGGYEMTSAKRGGLHAKHVHMFPIK